MGDTKKKWIFVISGLVIGLAFFSEMQAAGKRGWKYYWNLLPGRSTDKNQREVQPEHSSGDDSTGEPRQVIKNNNDGSDSDNPMRKAHLNGVDIPAVQPAPPPFDQHPLNQNRADPSVVPAEDEGDQPSDPEGSGSDNSGSDPEPVQNNQPADPSPPARPAPVLQNPENGDQNGVNQYPDPNAPLPGGIYQPPADLNQSNRGGRRNQRRPVHNPVPPQNPPQQQQTNLDGNYGKVAWLGAAVVITIVGYGMYKIFTHKKQKPKPKPKPKPKHKKKKETVTSIA